jgi:hypothetical protein
MSDEANNILKQASQGSVAAIIQILNEKLADSGVRTRAVFADGVLQLLCEAATAAQLESSILVERVRQILEAIAPRNIHRVNINSRIVREQQLLWLEEISRDPHNQLLWSKEITLRKPNFLQQLIQDWKAKQGEPRKDLSKLFPPRPKGKPQFWYGLMGGTGISMLLVIAGWLLLPNLGAFQRVSSPSKNQTQTQPPESNPATTANQVSAPTAASSLPPVNSAATSQGDSFVRAVRIAEQASQAGLSAKSSAQWLELAARWQKASDLMTSVPANDDRYQTAQNRAVAYRNNSESALQQAEKYKTQLSETSAQTEQSTTTGQSQ